MKRLDYILNTIIGAFVGAFLGHGLWRYLDYCRHPDLYAMQSAPWYTSILFYGVFTAGLVLVAVVLKLVLRQMRQRKISREERDRGAQ